jgi:aminopeptidase N
MARMKISPGPTAVGYNNRSGVMVQPMNVMRLAARTAQSFACALTLLVALATAAWSQAPFAFDSTPGKLPKSVVPHHYAIELEPDLERLTLAGTELVDIEVREATARIVLNALDLTLTRAELEGERLAAAIALDPEQQTATLTFAQPLAAGRYRLRIDFRGRIDRANRGLYVVDYAAGAGSKRMLSSHLEPADARRVFPCWDEPAFKATFALTVTLPRALTAISNMPVAGEEPVTPSLKQVTFQPTPKMSTYLFALVAGEFERLSGEVDGIAVNVVTTPGKREQARFALASALDLMRYFNDYFGLRYPLPKLDLIAVPGGFSGAMENWGAVTFLQSRLLFDPRGGGEDGKRAVFAFVAHELAHQWFGNLVTMAWWDDLWLSEGFASWMEKKAAEHFYPQWQPWLNGNARKQAAMTIDARRNARPLRRPIADERAAMAAFDTLTYGKGQALIRMIESYLGERAFRDGVRRYLAGHAYGNATSGDLWRALDDAGSRPVADIAATFTEQAGVPLIRLESRCEGEEQRLRLRQAPFGRHDSAATRWRIPVALGALRARRPQTVVLLTTEETEIAGGRCGEAVKLNFGDTGYFRVQYDEAMRTAFARSLPLMAPADRRLGADRGGTSPGGIVSRTARRGRRRGHARRLGDRRRRLRPDRPQRARPAGTGGVSSLCARHAQGGLRPARLGRAG